ncbi:unnamed protein product [Adineta steineri]|uniref:UPF3 domain-containing protein n=1 Tax=Adineta steineri TaxID=433720 RepID=A0A815LUW2_9BILA|nr:unnamed protein product [Adineta steineri]CAF1415534.1 unnamed protein product [Adineta steineri]
MVDGARTNTKQQTPTNTRSFSDQNQTKIVLRRLPPLLTSEQFLEIVSPLPDHDYYRFCKADLSFGQQYAFSRVYLNIPNRQDLIIFTEKFQGYVFVDKNGNEYPCTVEYAPNQSYPKSEQQSRKDPKLNSIEQDPEYQTFLANINAPLSASEALPNAETILEEIEKKQRDLQESKNKPGVTTTPLLEFLRRKREEKKQEKMIRIQQNQQRRNNKQQPSRNDDDYNTSARYGSGGDRSNRQQRGYDKSDYRTSNQEQKRPNDNNKSAKNRESQNPKSKQASSSSQQQSSKESKTILNTKSNNEESSQIETQTKRDTESIDTTNDNIQNDERPNSSNKASSSAAQKNPNAPVKNRPSIQIYNPGERAKMRKQQPPSS